MLVGLVAYGCSDASGDQQAESDRWTPPTLLERTPGLDAGDYAVVRKQSETYRTALTNNPSDTRALIGLAQVFMYEARVTGEHPYYYPEALALLNKAVAIEPDNYQAVVSKASVLLSLHKFSEALAVAERAVELAPNVAAGYGALIDSYVELGRYDEAVTAADKMVAIRPDLKSYSRVSYLREIHGDTQGAIEVMHLAVEAGAPGSEEKAWAQTTLGGIYLHAGQLEKAEREYLMASLERDRFPFALAGLAEVQTARGHTDSALALLDTALALIPEFSFMEMKADIHRAAGHDAVADSLVRVVIDMLKEDEASGHDIGGEMALLLSKHGMQPDDAVRYARAELDKRPESIDALSTMAYALLKADRAEEAKTYMDKARRQGKESASMIAHAGMIEVRLGNKREGNALLRKALTINPHAPALLRNEISATANNS